MVAIFFFFWVSSLSWAGYGVLRPVYFRLSEFRNDGLGLYRGSWLPGLDFSLMFLHVR